MSVFGTIVSALLACAAARQAADEPVIVQGQPFKIIVSADSTPETAVARQQIAVNDQLRDAFGDSPIEWDPGEFLDRATLHSTTSDSTLAVGRRGKAPVYVAFTRPHLKVGEPAELRIGVEKPHDLSPGVYRGELATRFSSAKVGALLEYHWPIELVVVGRRLAKVAFKADRLHVGSSSDLTVTVETVGCETGEGSLEIDWWRTSKKPDLLLKSTLPLPEPIDPAVSTSLVECHRRWRDEVLFAPVREIADASKGGATSGVTTHEIDVHLPLCPAQGFMRAKLTWPQAAEAANSAALAIETDAQPVGPGILAWPMAPAVGERVRVDACGMENLGDELILEVHPPDGPIEEVVLDALRDEAQDDETGPFEYRGYFQPSAPGAYRIAAPTGGKAEAALADSITVLTYFLSSSRVGADAPLTVFAGPAPFWWTLLNGSAPSWRASQPQAFSFGDATGTLSRMRLKSSGIFQRRNGEWSPLDRQNDPAIRLTSAAAADGDAWDLANHEQMVLGLDVDLAPVEPVDQPRHAIGQRQCWARMIVDARDSKGEPLQRIAVFPFNVDVDTAEWGNLIGIAALVGGALIFAIAGLLVWRALGGASRPRAIRAASAPVSQDGSLLGGPSRPPAKVSRPVEPKSNDLPSEPAASADDDVEPIL